MGQGRTGRRSRHRKHGPNTKERPHTATLPAGKSPAGGQSTGLSVPPLYGMRNEDVLKQCWRAIRQDAAAGVEHVSAQEYAPHLDENLHGLVERLKQKRYHATLVSRHALPTGDGTQRPLGIPAGEDTLLHLAVARLLDAIDEQDVLRCSSG